MKRVLITGITGDIGRAIASRFIEAEYAVVGLYHSNHEQAKKLESTLGCEMRSLDFGSMGDVPSLDCDVLVNNAGVNYSDRYCHETPLADWRKTIEINTITPIRLAAAVIPGMIERCFGRILNISSIYGLVGSECNGPYNVSKHALSGFTKSIAHEYASAGITANEICPGPVESTLLNRIASAQSDTSPEDYIKEISSEVPAQRLAKPADVASAAWYLASEEAGYINGVSLVVDGGMIC
ncbi:MAG: SDR family oxidoreductase [Rhodovibrionaceae bacterium]